MHCFCKYVFRKSNLDIKEETRNFFFSFPKKQNFPAYRAMTKSLYISLVVCCAMLFIDKILAFFDLLPP